MGGCEGVPRGTQGVCVVLLLLLLQLLLLLPPLSLLLLLLLLNYYCCGVQVGGVCTCREGPRGCALYQVLYCYCYHTTATATAKINTTVM